MLYDRPYMSSGHPSGGGFSNPFGGFPLSFKRILFILIGVFLLQKLLWVWFDQGTLLLEWFSLNALNFSEGKIWTLITYSFIHQDFWHLLGNGLLIFFSTIALIRLVDEKTLLAVYFLAALGGGLVSLMVQYFSMPTILIGASAAGLGLLTLYCLLEPERSLFLMLFFILPIQIKTKWLLWTLLFIDGAGFLFQELPLMTGRFIQRPGPNIAHGAHLGGILVGYLAFLYLTRWQKQGKSIHISKPSWFKRTSESVKYRYEISKNSTEEQVDAILDKVKAKGFASLTKEERSILQRASQTK